MRTILELTRKDIRIFWADTPAVILTFAVPMALITIFGLAFGTGTGNGPSGIRLLLVNEAQTPAAAKLVEALEQGNTFRLQTQFQPEGTTEQGEPLPPLPLSEDKARELLATKANDFRYVLVLPKNLFSFETEDFGLNIRLLYNPQQSIENEMVQGLLQKTLFTEALPLFFDELMTQATGVLGDAQMAEFENNLSALIARSFQIPEEQVRRDVQSIRSIGIRGLFAPAESGTSIDSASDPADPSTPDSAAKSPPTETSFGIGSILHLDAEQVFGRGINPAAQSTAGNAVLFLLFTLSAAAASLMDEKKSGIFPRLLAGPVSPAHILWSKYLFLVLQGMAQLTWLLLYGHLLFGIFQHLGQVPLVALVALSSVMACTAFGMLLAAFCKTSRQASEIGTFFILTMSALGGAMFPLFLLPAFMQDFVAPLTLTYWSVQGMLAVLWRDATLLQILPYCAILLAFASIANFIALQRFRHKSLFT